MPTPLNSTTVNETFFQPLDGLAAASPHGRPCPDFSDEDYIRLGVQRVLDTSDSGRALLQEHGGAFKNTPGHSNYVAALNSQRRCDLVGELNVALLTAAHTAVHDRLAAI